MRHSRFAGTAATERIVVLRRGSADPARYNAASLMGLHTSAASLPSCSAIIFRTSTRTASVSCDCKFTGIQCSFRGMMPSASHSTVTSSDGASFHTFGACLENYDQSAHHSSPCDQLITPTTDRCPVRFTGYAAQESGLRSARQWSALPHAAVHGKWRQIVPPMLWQPPAAEQGLTRVENAFRGLHE